MTKQDDTRARLMQIKAEERAKLRHETALRTLSDQRANSFEGKVQAVRTIHHADRQLLVSALMQMMKKDN